MVILKMMLKINLIMNMKILVMNLM